MTPAKRNYVRHLPHQIPENFPIFLTWNLKGAMPRKVWQMLQRERRRLEKQPDRVGESRDKRKIRESKVIFLKADRALDGATTGPMYLKDPAAAKTVEVSILFGVPERYDLFAWCVMSNHVHVLVTPRWELQDISQGIKGFTAHKITGLQKKRGRFFWQDESYDHWARDEDELLRIIAYIENNPEVAGLCQKPEDWPWSSARYRKTWLRGTVYQKSTSGFPA